MADTYTLDKTPNQTIAICKVCGTRRAANDSPVARRLIRDHVQNAHVLRPPKPVQ